MSKKKKKKKILKKCLKSINSNKSKFSLTETLTMIVISIMIGILIGSSVTYNQEKTTLTKIPNELESFIETYNDILRNYYDKTSKKRLAEAAIKGMIDSLGDPYSEVLDKNTSDAFNRSIDGEYVGIGVIVRYDNKSAIIDYVYKNSPSEKVGLKKGDKIKSIDGKDVTNSNLDKISKLIKGPSNTTVRIKVLRKSKEKTFKVKRKVIPLQSVGSTIIKKDNQKIGYLGINVFSANTDKQFRKELKALEKKKIDSLIIDVRNNPGGKLLQVTNILELFIHKNKTLYRIQKGKITKKIKDTTDDYRKYKICVLINHSSASASEVLSSALKEVYGAKLVGETTYGKGTVQNSYKLSNNVTLKYTTQKWLTSKGKWINKKGVKPDYEISLDDNYYESYSKEDDNQLQKALEILVDKKEEKNN